MTALVSFVGDRAAVGTAAKVGNHFFGSQEINFILILELRIQNVQVLIAYVNDVVEMFLSTVDSEKSLRCTGYEKKEEFM